jgi:hypothetical protein
MDVRELTHFVRLCDSLSHGLPILAPGADMDESELEASRMPENIQHEMIFPKGMTFKLVLLSRISFQ